MAKPNRGSVPAAAVDDEWSSEAAVVDAVARHLEREGWIVEARANTGSRQHGVDLVMVRGSRRRAVEAKGFPSRTYAAGEKAGQRKQWTHPAARSYMGDLLLELALLPEAAPGAEVAIALPNKPTFVHLIERLRAFLDRIGAGVYLVHEDGRVGVVAEPKKPTW